MGRWWRAYDEAVDDPKLCLLTDRQHRAWFNLCCITSQNGGVLPAIEAIAFKLRMPVAKARAIIDELRRAGLIDDDGNGTLRPHNWDGRQFQSDVSTQRVHRFRERQRNVSSAVSETPPDTDTDTETESEKDKTIGADAPFVFSDWPKDFRERFWQAYPRKVGKLGALRELERVKHRKLVPFSQLLEAVERYGKTADPKFTKHPKTWLSNGCWDDVDQAKVAGQDAVECSVRPGSAQFDAWRTFYRDNNKKFVVSYMDDAQEWGKQVPVPSEWPPGYQPNAAI